MRLPRKSFDFRPSWTGGNAAFCRIRTRMNWESSPARTKHYSGRARSSVTFRSPRIGRNRGYLQMGGQDRLCDALSMLRPSSCRAFTSTREAAKSTVPWPGRRSYGLAVHRHMDTGTCKQIHSLFGLRGADDIGIGCVDSQASGCVRHEGGQSRVTCPISS
jgi:hypothetical protein